MKKLIYSLLLVTGIFSGKTLFASDCHADFEFTIDGATVHFNNLSTADPGPILTYLWNFGDGTTSTEINPTHTYAVSGDYDVCLVITADGGCTSDRCDHANVEVAGTCSAAFEYSGSPEVHFTSITDPTDVTAYLWNFGDGTYSDGENPNHTYTTPGTYLVCLTVVYATGCTAEYCDEVVVGGGGDCTALFEVSGITGSNVHFFGHVEPAADVVTYVWNFGDGTIYTETGTGAGVDPWHEYAEPGVYTVCLSITTGDGCTDEYCSEVVITGGAGDCASNFEFNADGLNVNFYETATGDVVSYSWDFGDGSFSDAANPSHNYTEAGSYEVCLTITTAGGCTSVHCELVEITAGGGDCEADFEFTDTGLDVHFFETADGAGADIISYTWTFGDGAVGTGMDPWHTYTDAGTYVVCLTIVTADGCTSTFCDEVSVEAGDPGDCHAEFSVASLEFTPDGWVIHLTNESTATADITSVIWYFGDGSIGDSYDAEHVYLEAGSYLICVVITTADGCTSEYCDEIFIGAEGGDCESDFEWTNDGLTIHYTETADGGGSEIIGYTWSFGDGSTGTGPEISHTYDYAEEYEVCLTIVTADSCISTHCEIIHVESPDAPCSAGFELTSLEATADGWVAHFDNTSDGTEIYHWDFGDGTVSDATNPEHLFSEPGIYTICLTVGEEGTDCYDTYCEEIFIGDGDDCIDETVIVPEEDCGGVYEPVCGCDGVTYENACVAKFHHGVLYWTAGECSMFLTVEEENIFASVQLSPNPAQNSVNIHYLLRNAADVRIDITDVTGRQIIEVYNQPSVAGNYNFNMNTTDLASGIYLVRITAGKDQTVQKLIIAK